MGRRRPQISGNRQLRFPHGLAILEQAGARAELVVADQKNLRLQCFDPESGEMLTHEKTRDACEYEGDCGDDAV